MNSHRVKALLADQDFVDVVDAVRATLTKKVMSKSTSEDERQALLAEYHALDSLIARMRSEAENARNEDG